MTNDDFNNVVKKLDVILGLLKTSMRVQATMMSMIVKTAPNISEDQRKHLLNSIKKFEAIFEGLPVEGGPKS